MKEINIQYYKTAIGELIIGSFEGELCLMDYRYRKQRNRVDTRIQKGLSAEYVIKSDDIIEKTISQIDLYLRAETKHIDIPLLMVGSDFQKSVWKALLEIPYGSTASYMQIANMIGNPKSVRAVANANGANAIAVIIPCHRIIGSDGSLVGYAGGLKSKRKLLEIERAPIMGMLDL